MGDGWATDCCLLESAGSSFLVYFGFTPEELIFFQGKFFPIISLASMIREEILRYSGFQFLKAYKLTNTKEFGSLEDLPASKKLLTL